MVNQKFLTVFFASLTAYAAGASSTVASAAIQVFPTRQQPFVIEDSAKMSTETLLRFSTESTGLSRAEAVQEVVDFVAAHRAEFGLKEVSRQVLRFKNAISSSRGTSIRLGQYFQGKPIIGAELIALTNTEGEITVLNSSLIPTPRISTLATVTREQALAAAFAALGYEQPELGSSPNEGLVITFDRPELPVLTWQFSVRDVARPGLASLVQVAAQSPGPEPVVRVLPLGMTATTPVTIYDSSITFVTPNPTYPGFKVINKGKKTLPSFLVSEEATLAQSNFDKILDFYSSQFGRDGYDAKTSEVIASVNVQRIPLTDIYGMRQNAAWIPAFKMFIFGAGGSELAGFTGALDVVGHEFTHAVVTSTADLDMSGQSGALNEHLADVFGAMINRHYNNPQNPFLVGSTVLRGELKKKAEALRDMLHPEKSLTAQPTQMSEIPAALGPSCIPSSSNDRCGVHLLNGIPNRAVALILQYVGWEKTAPLFYRVMTERLLAKADFIDYRNQVLDECKFWFPEATCESMSQAFREAGIE